MLTELIENLFIGNWVDAKQSSEFAFVVTCAVDSQFRGDACFDLVDGPGNTLEEFSRAVSCVCAAHLTNKPVIVHCVGGRSRSAAVIVAAAAKITGRPMCEVYDLLLSKHDGSGCGARIHPHLSKLLLEFMGE